MFDLEREDRHLIDPCEYFRAGGGELWVGELDKTVVGCAGVVIRRRPAHVAELKSVYVAHEVRRRGLARALVTGAVEHAAAARCPRVVLWSDTLQ